MNHHEHTPTLPARIPPATVTGPDVANPPVTPAALLAENEQLRVRLSQLQDERDRLLQEMTEEDVALWYHCQELLDPPSDITAAEALTLLVDRHEAARNQCERLTATLAERDRNLHALHGALAAALTIVREARRPVGAYRLRHLQALDRLEQILTAVPSPLADQVGQ